MEASASPQPVETAPAKAGILARLARGSASYAVATFATRGFSFLLLPVYTHFLSPADYGLVSLSDTVAISLQMLGGLGLAPAVQRLYFKYEGDERAAATASVLRAALAWLAIVLGVALLLGEPILRLVAPRFAAPFFPFVALSLVTAAGTLVIDYRQTLFQTEERPSAYARLALASFALNAAAALSLVAALRWGAVGMLLGKTLGTSTSALLAIFLMRRELRGRWSTRRVREAVAIGAPLVPHVLVATLLTSADSLVIQAYRPVAEVGLYAIAYAIGGTVTVVTSTLMLAWTPVFYDMAKHADRDRAILGHTSLFLSTLLVGAALIGSACVEDVMRVLLPVRYHASGRLVPIIMGGYVFHWFFSLFHLSVMQSGKTYLIAATTMFAAMVNMALNFLWIPSTGAVGAAYATLVAYAAEAIFIYWTSQRLFRIPYRLGAMGAVVAAYLVVLAATQVPGDALRRAVVAGTALPALGVLGLVARHARRHTLTSPSAESPR